MSLSVLKAVIVFCLSVGFVVGSPMSARAENWPQWRGPKNNGISAETKLPAKWSKTENVEWIQQIPGRGWSSPIVTGDKVFLTTAVTEGKSKSPQIGTEYSNEYSAELRKQGLSPQEIRDRSAVALRVLQACLHAGPGYHAEQNVSAAYDS